MKQGYKIFNKFAIKYNLSLTPAYDVIGLFATFSKIIYYFNVSLYNKDKWNSSTLTLKDTYINKKTLNYLLSEISNLDKFNLLIITDHGEECDDEITLQIANILNYYGINVTLCFTNSNEIEKQKYINWSKEISQTSKLKTKICRIFDNNTKETDIFSGNRNVIYLCGPLHTNNNTHKEIFLKLKSFNTYSYEYYQLGLPGTLNCKGDAEDTALYLFNNAQIKYLIDTKRGKGAPHFNVNMLKELFGNTSLIEHVIKIAWRNTVGRADSKIIPGKFIAHLIAESEYGANYQLILNLENTLKLHNVKKINIIDSKISYIIQETIDNYIYNLYNTGKTNAFNGTNSVVGKNITKTSIENGYKFILSVLYEYFDVYPILFISGSPENWHPQWLDL